MTCYKRYLAFVIAFTLGNLQYAFSNTQLAQALAQLQAFKAVGFVVSSTDLSPDDLSSREADLSSSGSQEGGTGTGTHIGDGIVITAAHIFQELMPRKSKGPGPVVIDVKKLDVFWSDLPDSNAQTTQSQEYKAIKVVVDGRYVQALNSGDGEAQDKHDIAFVKLERMPSASIPLADNFKTLPSLGVIVGYGTSSQGRKHAILQDMAPEKKLNGWSFLLARSQFADMPGYINASPERKAVCNAILGHACGANDTFYLLVHDGDSGGPLITSIDGKNQIVGVLSSSDDEDNIEVEEWFYEGQPNKVIERKETKRDRHNFYASTINGSNGSYTMNPDIRALLNEAKR